MRENVEREGVGREEGDSDWRVVEGKKPQRRKGFVHRLEQDITSFFFTNFLEDATVNNLWFEFERFGHVGEVYLPKKLDKQGSRFGFVKYREVQDDMKLLSRMEDIWLGSFKLRINKSRFGKGEPKKTKEAEVLEPSKEGGARQSVGRSFKDALVVAPEKHQLVNTAGSGLVHGVHEVVWEVEVESELMAKLNGAYVGFLAEAFEVQTIQHNFLMDGYHSLKVILLGHRKVLLTSTAVGEVEELVGSVWWWSTWFDRFELWSPESVSSQRYTWLRCYGVPLHAWGEALFRTIGFKFGTFVDTDQPTKLLRRGDVARISITTEKLQLIDSSVSITVMGRKFVIRVLEELRGFSVLDVDRRSGAVENCVSGGRSSKGSVDGGSIMAAVQGLSEGGSDEDWSENGSEVHGVGSHKGGKGLETSTRLVDRHEDMMSGIDPNILGNNLNLNTSRVNREVAMVLSPCVRVTGAGVLSAKRQGMLGDVLCYSDPICLHEREKGRMRLVGSVDTARRCVGAVKNDGPGRSRPTCLRTKNGDLPVGGFFTLKGGRIAIWAWITLKINWAWTQVRTQLNPIQLMTWGPLVMWRMLFLAHLIDAGT
jgi:hypothetical protein